VKERDAIIKTKTTTGEALNLMKAEVHGRVS